MKVYELSDKEFRTILFKNLVDYKNTQTNN